MKFVSVSDVLERYKWNYSRMGQIRSKVNFWEVHASVRRGRVLFRLPLAQKVYEMA